MESDLDRKRTLLGRESEVYDVYWGNKEGRKGTRTSLAQEKKSRKEIRFMKKICTCTITARAPRFSTVEETQVSPTDSAAVLCALRCLAEPVASHVLQGSSIRP